MTYFKTICRKKNFRGQQKVNIENIWINPKLLTFLIDFCNIRKFVNNNRNKKVTNVFCFHFFLFDLLFFPIFRGRKLSWNMPFSKILRIRHFKKRETANIFLIGSFCP